MAPLKSVRSQRPQQKHSSVAQREKKVALLQEIEVLRAQLRVQRRRVKCGKGPAVGIGNARSLTLDVRENDLWLAGLRGLLCGHTTASRPVPFSRPLTLPKDPMERRQIMEDYHVQSVQDAGAFLHERCVGVDLRTPYSSLETFQDPTKDELGSDHFGVTPFPGISSVRCIFDAMRFFAMNLEICVTEYLGTLTVREDDGNDELVLDDNGDGFASVRRMRSTAVNGVTITGQQAIFAQLYDQVPDPHGLVAIHPVDADNQWLHRPHGRVFVKVTGMLRITKLPNDGGVVLVKSMAFRLHRGKSTASTQQLSVALKHGMHRWTEVLEQVVCDRVYGAENNPPPPPRPL